ncbi:ribosomal silencing factor RsfS [Iodidimonas muriae]|uniref:Ribosomal silencing factor RsfS n=2 Tax=Iodidimonas muriae TaxID=261467 RepID=A0ABQ2LFH1_9PROT|nr:ribosome silencing factor [Iodidimonas muriae]GER08621.1 ribosomal silencing factor RsfS [Kordiimonadales bacterium JCM 17843]GGO15782.1 ribosomal silencing factor RsfS [Iodidimonas muriae]
MHASEPTPSVTSKSMPAVSGKLLETVLATLDDNKAEEIVSIPLSGKSSIADHMIVANGRSSRQVAAIADHIVRTLREQGLGHARVEGLPQADWVLIDAGDVIVHLFRPEVRSFYNLEKMWAADLGAEPVAH